MGIQEDPWPKIGDADADRRHLFGFSSSLTQKSRYGVLRYWTVPLSARAKDALVLPQGSLSPLVVWQAPGHQRYSFVGPAALAQ